MSIFFVWPRILLSQSSTPGYPEWVARKKKSLLIKCSLIFKQVKNTNQSHKQMRRSLEDGFTMQKNDNNNNNIWFCNEEKIALKREDRYMCNSKGQTPETHANT